MSIKGHCILSHGYESGPDATKVTALAEAAGINKTALLLVGHFLGFEYAYSKLYDPGFSHGFRAAKS